MYQSTYKGVFKFALNYIFRINYIINKYNDFNDNGLRNYPTQNDLLFLYTYCLYPGKGHN